MAIVERPQSAQDGQRLDYQAKLTGRAPYLADMKMAGVCEGAILRSPVAHAWIRYVDASEALKVPGVVTAYTRDDVVQGTGIEPYYGPVFKDQTIVAVDKVRHVGDPVAAVVAETREAAEEAVGRPLQVLATGHKHSRGLLLVAKTQLRERHSLRQLLLGEHAHGRPAQCLTR